MHLRCKAPLNTLDRVMCFPYLTAEGNFIASDCFSFFPDYSPKSRLIQLKKEKLEYSPGEHEYGLFPAPIHVGEYLSTRYIAEKECYFLSLGEVSLCSCYYFCISIGVKLFLHHSVYTPSEEFCKLCGLGVQMT